MVADSSTLVGEGLNPVQAYLNIPSIIKVAKKHQIDAIHPGYGLLSERPDFAREVESNGMMFIGPPHTVVHRMGDKTETRQNAINASVPVIPGTETAVKSVEEACTYCEQIGYPVMLKAAYGGGGRGMRRVNEAKYLKEEFLRATSEALSAVWQWLHLAMHLAISGRRSPHRSSDFGRSRRRCRAIIRARL